MAQKDPFDPFRSGLERFALRSRLRSSPLVIECQSLHVLSLSVLAQAYEHCADVSQHLHTLGGRLLSCCLFHLRAEIFVYCFGLSSFYLMYSPATQKVACRGLNMSATSLRVHWLRE